MNKKKKYKSIKKVKKKRKSKGAILLFSLLFSIIFIGAAYYFYSRSTRAIRITKSSVIMAIPNGFPSFGIDISHHQGEINWDLLLLKEHYDTIIQFVYCKATEGSDHIDTQWKQNRKILQKVQMPNGAYHFFIPTSAPRPQVDNFLSVWTPSAMDLPPVLDVEVEVLSDADLIEKMKIWLTEVENRTGMRPIIYTSRHFFESKFNNAFKDYKFWIAAYSNKPDCIEDSRIVHWQYSESGKLPGISENVDFNVSKIALEK